MNKIKVTNIKCQGCANHIKTELEKLDIKNIKINIPNQIIEFEGDEEKTKQKLTQLGYPEHSSNKAKSILTKTKSFMSCAIGKIQK